MIVSRFKVVKTSMLRSIRSGNARLFRSQFLAWHAFLLLTLILCWCFRRQILEQLIFSSRHLFPTDFEVMSYGEPLQELLFQWESSIGFLFIVTIKGVWATQINESRHFILTPEIKDVRRRGMRELGEWNGTDVERSLRACVVMSFLHKGRYPRYSNYRALLI